MIHLYKCWGSHLLHRAHVFLDFVIENSSLYVFISILPLDPYFSHSPYLVFWVMKGLIVYCSQLEIFQVHKSEAQLKGIKQFKSPEWIGWIQIFKRLHPKENVSLFPGCRLGPSLLRRTSPLWLSHGLQHSRPSNYSFSKPRLYPTPLSYVF